MYNPRQVIINLVVVTLLCLVIFSYFKFLEYRRYSRNVEHTYQVLNSILQLEGELTHLQALRRGYMPAPGDMTDQIRESRAQVRQKLDTLSALISDNSAQISHIVHVRNCLDTSGIYEREKLPLAPVGTSNDLQLIRLDKVYEHLNQMEQIENKLMSVRASSKKESEGSLPVLILITGVAAIVLLSYAFYMMNEELKQRVKTSRALESNIQQLNLTNEELERFAFIASHNLKEPIRKARTTLSRIQMDSELKPVQIGEKIRKTDNLLEQLQHLLDDLLIYTKLVHLHENKELVSLDLVFNKTLQEFATEIKECGASISCEKLPAVPGYSAQILLVFSHLLSNSIKYRKLTEKLIIRVSTHINANSNHLVVDFEDNGIGFDTHYTQKVFEVFGRLHPRDEYAGTGIGLAICRRVMSNHDGFIHASSEPGQGTKFSLYFPVATGS